MNRRRNESGKEQKERKNEISKKRGGEGEERKKSAGLVTGDSAAPGTRRGLGGGPPESEQRGLSINQSIYLSIVGVSATNAGRLDEEIAVGIRASSISFFNDS